MSQSQIGKPYVSQKQLEVIFMKRNHRHSSIEYERYNLFKDLLPDSCDSAKQNKH